MIWATTWRRILKAIEELGRGRLEGECELSGRQPPALCFGVTGRLTR